MAVICSLSNPQHLVCCSGKAGSPAARWRWLCWRWRLASWLPSSGIVASGLISASQLCWGSDHFKREPRAFFLQKSLKLLIVRDPERKRESSVEERRRFLKGTLMMRGSQSSQEAVATNKKRLMQLDWCLSHYHLGLPQGIPYCPFK